MTLLIKQGVSLVFETDKVKNFLNYNENDDQESPFLQRVKISTIPTFEVFVLANETNFVVLSVTDNEELGHKKQLHPTGGFTGHYSPLVSERLDDVITSVACWPVAPSRLTDPRPYEWTSIIVGLKSGIIRFYTDRGYFLMRQQFSRTKVIDIRVEVDELSVLYEDCYVTVNGLTLLAGLKTCRQKVARGEHIDEHEPVEILCRKYSLDGVLGPCSTASTGIYKQCFWDQITTASSVGGYNAKLSGIGGGSNPIQIPYDTFCSVGKVETRKTTFELPRNLLQGGHADNFVNFNWHSDGMRGASDIISDTLQSVTNRFKSSFGLPSVLTGSFWGGSGNNQSSSKKPKNNASAFVDQQKIVKVPQRSGLYDQSRKGERLALSANGRLAAICDDHARVIMLDIRRRLALRIWKGYRDAQCGWLEIAGSATSGDTSHGGNPYKNCRKTLCLVIFAPKRGILELWSSQNGRRVAAFNVDKDGVLLYCPPTSSAHSNNSDQWKPVRFLDSQGNLHIPNVSFEVATDKRTTSTYWTADVKENFNNRWLKRAKSHPDDAEEDLFTELNRTVSSINTIKDLRYFVDLLFNKPDNLSFHLAAKFLDAILDRLKTLCGDDDQLIGGEQRVFLNSCLLLKQCVNFYAVVCNFWKKKYDDEIGDLDNNESVDAVADLLFVKKPFLLALCQDLDDNLAIREDADTDKDDVSSHTMDLLKFLSFFDLNPSRSSLTADVFNADKLLPLHLSSNITEDGISELGHFLFTPFLTNFSPAVFERDVRHLFGVTVQDWTLTLCRFWLNTRRSYSVHPQRLYKLLLTVFELSNENDELDDRNSYGTYLDEARNVMMNSCRTAECLCLCLVLRAVAKQCQKVGHRNEEFENIDNAVEDWDLLLKMLHGLLLSDTFVRHVTDRSCSVKKSGFSVSPSSSLNDVLSMGYGFVAEEIAKRLANFKGDFNISPQQLIELFSKNSESETSETTISLKNCVQKLKDIYSHSLTPVALASNLCWENVRRWYSHVTDVKPLLISIEYLQLVDDVHVRRGLSSLIWLKFLNGFTEELCLILDDLQGGNSPALLEKRFQDKTQIKSEKLSAFLRATFDVCRTLHEDASNFDVGGVAMATRSFFNVEDFVQEFFDAFGGVKHSLSICRSALLTVCGDQPKPDKRRTRIHYVLSLILVMITDQQGALTETSPYVLFTETEEDLLFEQLHNPEDSSNANFNENTSGSDESASTIVDKRLHNTRINFLKSWINAVLSQQSSKPNVQYAFDLASEWSVNVDELRRFEIYQLFANNRAEEASKLVHFVEERQQLAKELLDLVCQSLCVQIQRDLIKPSLSSRLETYLQKFMQKSKKAVLLNLKTSNSIMLFVYSAVPRKSEQLTIAKDLQNVLENLCHTPSQE